MRNALRIAKFSLGLTLAATSLVTLFSFTALAQSFPEAKQDCKTDLNEAAVTAEACPLPSAEKLVRVTVNRPHNSLVVEATFRTEKLWQEIYVASGDGKVTAQEQKELRMAVIAKGADRLDPSVRSVVDFLANFLEPETKLEPFQRLTRPRLFSGSSLGYTMICDYIGKEKEAVFTIKGFTISSLAPVGQLETRCRGRCGLGCYQPLQWRSNQYTQECLNHDICRDHTGENFGDCTDAFWAAADGYLAAPDCPQKAVGTEPAPADSEEESLP